MSSGARGSQSQDFELNLASIIDCFTVLIAFMLITASFLSIGILDAGVAAAGSEAKPGEPPPINITLELKRDHSIGLKVQGKETQSESLAPAGKDWNLDGAKAKLEALKSKWPTVNSVSIQAENDVEYSDVIKVMDSTRKSMPIVLLGGF